MHISIIVWEFSVGDQVPVHFLVQEVVFGELQQELGLGQVVSLRWIATSCCSRGHCVWIFIICDEDGLVSWLEEVYGVLSQIDRAVMNVVVLWDGLSWRMVQLWLIKL